MTVPTSYLNYPSVLPQIVSSLSSTQPTMRVRTRSGAEATRLRTLFYGYRKALLREHERLGSLANLRHVPLLQDQYASLSEALTRAGAITCKPSPVGCYVDFTLTSAQYTLETHLSPIPIPLNPLSNPQPPSPPLWDKLPYDPLANQAPSTQSILDLFISESELLRADDPLNQPIPTTDDFPPDEEFTWS